MLLDLPLFEVLEVLEVQEVLGKVELTCSDGACTGCEHGSVKLLCGGFGSGGTTNRSLDSPSSMSAWSATWVEGS